MFNLLRKVPIFFFFLLHFRFNSGYEILMDKAKDLCSMVGV